MTTFGEKKDASTSRRILARLSHAVPIGVSLVSPEPIYTSSSPFYLLPLTHHSTIISAFRSCVASYRSGNDGSSFDG